MLKEMSNMFSLFRMDWAQDPSRSIQVKLDGVLTDVFGARVEPSEENPKSGKGHKQARTGTPRWEERHGLIPYRLYVPSKPVATAPLIVMLHGCKQRPEDFAAGTRMNAAAENIGAHVIWPHQRRSANMNGCWNWFEPEHQGRGGEAEIIADIAREVRAEVAPKASGIHVGGLSAGGAMAAILGMRYPDVFSSICVHSGLPVGSASNAHSAFSAMRSGGESDESSTVPAIIFHGGEDRTVAPANGPAVAASTQFTTKPKRQTSRIEDRKVTVTRAVQPNGIPEMELWEIEGLAHAWSGGDEAGSFADPNGPDATAEFLRFIREVDSLKS